MASTHLTGALGRALGRGGNLWLAHSAGGVSVHGNAAKSRFEASHLEAAPSKGPVSAIANKWAWPSG
jgi:hypothetical protein